MAKRNEHVVAIVLEDFPLDKEFVEWPLHITIVPWFHGYDEHKLDKILASIAAGKKQFTATVGENEAFGSKKDVAVNVIDDCPPLYELHNEVLRALEENGFEIHQKDYVGKTYRAHITHQEHGRRYRNDEVTIKSFALVKQKRMKGTGTIVKTLVKYYEFA